MRDEEVALVPDFRIRRCNTAQVNPEGDYILYWMIAYRRTHWNFALQRAVEWAQLLEKPLIIFEALRCGYEWASDRIHCFVMQGMRDNAARLRDTSVYYYPYVEPTPNAGKGLLRELGKRASVVVTDEFPAFFLPRMVNAAARQLTVLLEQVDSNGLLPIRWTDKLFTTAVSFRRFLQTNLEFHLTTPPLPDPIKADIRPFDPQVLGEIPQRWPPVTTIIKSFDKRLLCTVTVDHSVPPSCIEGGPNAANRTLERFLHKRIERYADYRNHPDEHVTSGLSPYLHFGHISVYQIFDAIAAREGWCPLRIVNTPKGQREGWWGMSRNAEAFLDQLITWRELGYNTCLYLTPYDRYESLPPWACETLNAHRNDPRPYVYSLEDLENAATHDPLWNAAQRQLVREGRLHNYLRMLWGKKILEWTGSPEEALAVMIHLNNKYALDGRNPNSYAGICWILGRYDRPWGPERPVFGKIRFMSSQNTARKLRVTRYLEKYAP